MRSIPFYNSKKSAASPSAPPTLAELSAQRADILSGRDAQARELEQLREERIVLATAGEELDAVRTAGATIAALTDSIALAGEVVAKLDQAIAPLQAEADVRAREEYLAAARLTFAASQDRANAAARSFQTYLAEVCDGIGDRIRALDAATEQLALDSRAVGSDVPRVAAFTGDEAPVMEQLVRELRFLPERLEQARVSGEGLRRADAGALLFNAQQEERRMAAYVASGQAAINAQRDAANEERNRAAEANHWSKRSA